MGQSILIVDDEKDMVEALGMRLTGEGYRISRAANAEQGLAEARRSRPDLILLDVGLPQMDGLELISILRRDRETPVIFLSGRNREEDRILGMKMGADDYVTKPFSMDELLARVRAILRRASGTAEKADSAVMSLGGLDIDLERHEVRVNGRFRSLTPREFELMKLLLKAKGRVLTRPALLETLWGISDGREIYTRTIDQHVARLRRKLRPEGKRIVTVKNYGYRLVTR